MGSVSRRITAVKVCEIRRTYQINGLKGVSKDVEREATVVLNDNGSDCRYKLGEREVILLEQPILGANKMGGKRYLFSK